MTTSRVPLTEFVSGLADSPLAAWATRAPWEITSQSEAIVRAALDALALEDYLVTGDVAVHRSAQVEGGAVLKGPLILGPQCFVAAGAYLRGGNWVARGCTFGPGAELKSSFVFAGTKLAHFNFVGDSILGSDSTWRPAASCATSATSAPTAKSGCASALRCNAPGATSSVR